MQSFELPDFYVPWPARLNPNLEGARTHSKAWAQEMGILGADKDSLNIWSEQAFDRHDYALLCSYIHPEAPSPELDLMTDWNVWAFYVDDYFLKAYKQSENRTGARQYLDRVLVFMPIDLRLPPATTNPMERALTDLWLRTAPIKSEDWRRRVVADMRSLLDAFLWELESKHQQRLANPIEYFEMRRQVGAALWSADLVEHAMFVEIPERIAATRPMQVLKDTFADAVHLRNDIFSYEREVLKEGELTNAVLVIERFLGVGTQHAVNLVNDLLTSRLQQFEHTALTELESLFQEQALDPLEQANVLTYLRGLQDWQSGAHEWHLQTSRYLNPQTPKPIASLSTAFIPSFSGLGIAAMHITPGTLRLSLNRVKNYKHTPYKKVGPTPLPEFYMPFTTEANSHLETVRQHSKAWARRMGMLDVLPGHPGIFIWDERRFDVFDLALFCALFHPKVTDIQLDLEVFWVVWGTYTDDYLPAVYGRTHDLVGAKLFCARLSEFMPVEPGTPIPVPLTPIERGLAEVWAASTSTLLGDERRKLRKVIEDMVASWLWELSNQIQNHIPDPIDYIKMRRKTCGSDQLMFFSRLRYGQGVPPEVHDTLTMQELNNTAIDYIWLSNDIFSYQREIEFEGEIHNGVLVIENFLGCNRTRAVEIVNNLLTARTKQFEHIVATDLPILFENFDLDPTAREQLLAYVETLQCLMSSALQWQFKTERYSEHESRRILRQFISHPTGLGTAAACIPTIAVGHKEKNDAALRPVVSCASPVTEENPETLKGIKTIAVSHLALPFQKRKEEARTDS